MWSYPLIERALVLLKNHSVISTSKHAVQCIYILSYPVYIQDNSVDIGGQVCACGILRYRAYVFLQASRTGLG